MSTRVVVADDSVLLREGLVRLLEESGFEGVGEAGVAEDLRRSGGADTVPVANVATMTAERPAAVRNMWWDP